MTFILKNGHYIKQYNVFYYELGLISYSNHILVKPKLNN